MAEDAIRQLHTYDWNVFKAERNFRRWQSPEEEVGSIVLSPKENFNIDEEALVENTENEQLLEVLKKTDRLTLEIVLRGNVMYYLPDFLDETVSFGGAELTSAETSRLPLYYRVYPGSIPDKAHLKYMTEDNEVLSSRKTRFVMDRGFYSAENMQYLVQKGCRFIIALPGSIGTGSGRPCGSMQGLPGHMKFCTELVDRHREELVNQAECWLGKGKPYGKAYEVTGNGYRYKKTLIACRQYLFQIFFRSFEKVLTSNEHSGIISNKTYGISRY